jgi:hypothetical protein
VENTSSPVSSKQRYSKDAEKMFSILDAKVDDVFNQVKAWSGWALVADENADPERFKAVVREIFLAVHMYQGHTTEAGFRMIGRLPKCEVKLMQVLTHHKADEAEHGLWAWQDYLALGGDKAVEANAESPATFAVAAVWWWMAENCNPYGYIGAEYLFENLTERVTKDIVAMLMSKSISPVGMRFIVEHATEDEKHSNLFRHLIKDTLTRKPESFFEMLRCFDLFNQVYPIPVWDEAYKRAIKNS